MHLATRATFEDRFGRPEYLAQQELETIEPKTGFRAFHMLSDCCANCSDTKHTSAADLERRLKLAQLLGADSMIRRPAAPRSQPQTRKELVKKLYHEWLLLQNEKLNREGYIRASQKFNKFLEAYIEQLNISTADLSQLILEIGNDDRAADREPQGATRNGERSRREHFDDIAKAELSDALAMLISALSDSRLATVKKEKVEVFSSGSFTSLKDAELQNLAPDRVFGAYAQYRGRYKGDVLLQTIAQQKPSPQQLAQFYRGACTLDDLARTAHAHQRFLGWTFCKGRVLLVKQSLSGAPLRSVNAAQLGSGVTLLKFVYQLCAAVIELHDLGYAHTRLNANNVVVRSNAGCALLNLEDCVRINEKPDLQNYLWHECAPELLFTRTGNPELWDAWSVGVLLCELLKFPAVLSDMAEHMGFDERTTALEANEKLKTYNRVRINVPEVFARNEFGTLICGLVNPDPLSRVQLRRLRELLVTNFAKYAAAVEQLVHD